ncbi:MAG: hypothetical protein J6U92_01110 [Clostridia bacterium]|nr:hypothetical protein [Clostridia bacterium]
MDYTAEQLNQISIHSLRNIGREIGVKAPCSLTKNILIAEIIAIKSGKKEPCATTKKGRPPKKHIKEKILTKKQNQVKKTNSSKKTKKQIIETILKEIKSTLNNLL